MPMARRRAEPAEAPLFEWPRRRSVILIEAERASILARIGRLKPRSHARIIAEDRLRALTHQALTIEVR